MKSPDQFARELAPHLVFWGIVFAVGNLATGHTGPACTNLVTIVIGLLLWRRT